MSTSGGPVLTSANTTSASGVASRAIAVGVNTRISLVGEVGVVRASGVRSVGVGAVRVGASEAAASVGVAAVRQTGTLMVVSPGLFFKEGIRQLLAVSLIGLLT